MVKDQFLTFQSNVEIVQDRLTRIATRMPEVPEEEVEYAGELYRKELSKTLKQNEDDPDRLGDWTKKLRRSIKVESTGGQTDGVKKGLFIDFENNGVNIAAWHEYADTGHHVNPDNAPMLQDWVDDHLVDYPDWGGSIWVEPHPFIQPVAKRVAAKMREHVDNGGKLMDLFEEELDI